MRPARDREERFWEKVAKSAGCWEWTAGRDRDGYGKFSTSERRGEKSRAHRVAYEMVVGPIPDGMVLDHICRNPGCVNPAHLEPVTNRENILRGVGLAARNASKTHCPRGHLFDEENTIRRAGRRMCRICRTARARAAYLAKMQAA